MRIEQLKYLVAVEQQGSIRRACEHLHLSQPALTEALTKLERELGLKLLDRRRSGTTITDEGRDLLPHILEVLEAVDRLGEAAADNSLSRPVRVGVVHASIAFLLGPAVRALHERDPSITVDVVALAPQAIDEAVLRGDVDLTLINVLDGDAPPVGLDGIDLLHGRPVVVLPAVHHLADAHEVHPDDLRDEPLVMTRESYSIFRWLRGSAGAEEPRISHTTDGADTAKAMVAEGLGLTVLPDYAVAGGPMHRSGVIVTRPVAGDAARVRMQLRQRSAARPTRPVRMLVEALRASAAEHGRDPAPEISAIAV